MERRTAVIWKRFSFRSKNSGVRERRLTRLEGVIFTALYTLLTPSYVAASVDNRFLLPHAVTTSITSSLPLPPHYSQHTDRSHKFTLPILPPSLLFTFLPLPSIHFHFCGCYSSRQFWLPLMPLLPLLSCHNCRHLTTSRPALDPWTDWKTDKDDQIFFRSSYFMWPSWYTINFQCLC